MNPNYTYTFREVVEAIYYPNGDHILIQVVDDVKLPYNRVRFDKYEDFREHLFEETWLEETLYDAFRQKLREERLDELLDFFNESIDVDQRIDKKHQKFFKITEDEDYGTTEVTFCLERFLELTEDDKENRAEIIEEITSRLIFKYTSFETI